MPRCPDCYGAVVPVKGSEVDFYCGKCDVTWGVAELIDVTVAEQCGDTEFEWGYDPD